MEITFEQLPKAVTQLFDKISNIERLLIEKGGEAKNETPDQLLTIQQAGDLLNLSIPTLYGYVHRAEIPVCKKGKRLYFSKDDLTNWIKEGKKKTLAEISAEADMYLTKRKGGNHGK